MLWHHHHYRTNNITMNGCDCCTNAVYSWWCGIVTEHTMYIRSNDVTAALMQTYSWCFGNISEQLFVISWPRPSIYSYWSSSENASYVIIWCAVNFPAACRSFSSLAVKIRLDFLFSPGWVVGRVGMFACIHGSDTRRCPASSVCKYYLNLLYEILVAVKCYNKQQIMAMAVK